MCTSKSTDSSLLQQVTQVLGEMIPQTISTDITPTTGTGPHIVVQGTDQATGEFKVLFLAFTILAETHIIEFICAYPHTLVLCSEIFEFST